MTYRFDIEMFLNEKQLYEAKNGQYKDCKNPHYHAVLGWQNYRNLLEMQAWRLWECIAVLFHLSTDTYQKLKAGEYPLKSMGIPFELLNIQDCEIKLTDILESEYRTGGITILGTWNGINTWILPRIFLGWAHKNGYAIHKEFQYLVPPQEYLPQNNLDIPLPKPGGSKRDKQRIDATTKAAQAVYDSIHSWLDANSKINKAAFHDKVYTSMQSQGNGRDFQTSACDTFYTAKIDGLYKRSRGRPATNK